MGVNIRDIEEINVIVSRDLPFHRLNCQIAESRRELHKPRGPIEFRRRKRWPFGGWKLRNKVFYKLGKMLGRVTIQESVGVC